MCQNRWAIEFWMGVRPVREVPKKVFLSHIVYYTIGCFKSFLYGLCTLLSAFRQVRCHQEGGNKNHFGWGGVGKKLSLGKVKSGAQNWAVTLSKISGKKIWAKKKVLTASVFKLRLKRFFNLILEFSRREIYFSRALKRLGICFSKLKIRLSFFFLLSMLSSPK